MGYKNIISLKTIRKIVVYILLLMLFANYYEHYKIYEFKSHIQDSEFYVLDPISGHHHSTNYKTIILWPEHEFGKFDMTTNNLGFREDSSTNNTKSPNTKRILVTGDSHIDGVLTNKDSYPNVLERTLNKKNGSYKYEIINGGNGFFSFKNYYGILDKFKHLILDEFIITVYLGNDFIENLFYENDNLGFFSSPGYVYYRLKKKYIKFRTGFENSQYTNQAVFFNTFPSKIDRTIAIADNYLSKIKSICTEQGIELKVVVLPSALEVDKSIQSKFEKAGWAKATMSTNIEIKNRFIKKLESRQISFYDLSEEFSKSQKKLFWTTDSHLNDQGHRLTAKLVEKMIE